MPPKRKMPEQADQKITDDSEAAQASKQTWQLKPQKPDPRSFQVTQGGKEIPCLRYYPFSTSPAMIFTHGAGGTLAASAMVNFGQGFNDSKSLVYFQGPMNLKARTRMFQTLIKHEGWGEVLGGRSMGARAAVMAAQEDKQTKAVVLASYPLKNEKGEVRDQILLDLRPEVDVLFISGDNDEMCDIEELSTVRAKMKAKSWMVVVQGADHGMNIKPKKATDEIGKSTGRIAAHWLDHRDRKMTEREIGWDAGRGKAVETPWKTSKGTDAVEAVDTAEQSAEDVSAVTESNPRKKRKIGK